MTKPFIIIFGLCSFALTAQTPLSGSVNVYQADCNLGAAKIKADGGVPPYSFHWNNGAVGDSSSSLPDGNYTVHISDSDTSHNAHGVDVSFQIQVVCKANFSNKFSPNGDGINDTWTSGHTENYPNFFLQVFDRWGQVVHEQRKLFVPWDGTHLGIKMPDATYYFIFFYEEGKSSNIEKGSVTIVR